MAEEFEIPEGFEPLPTSSPFNQNVGPYYYKASASGLVMGLRVAEKHCNSGGGLHGAMVCAIADVAIGHNIGLTLAGISDFSEAMVTQQATHRASAPMATVSLSTDFSGTARLGDWVEVHVDVQKAGRTLAFGNAYLFNGDARIARISGVFRLLGQRRSREADED